MREPVIDLAGRARPVDPCVFRLEEVEVARHALVLRVAGIAVRDPLEDAGQHVPHRLGELRRELLPTMLVTERDPHLAEDVPRVELSVHVVEREADLGLAVADRRRDGARPTVSREKRRVPVDDAVARSRKSIRRNLPREPDAQSNVRVEVTQQRRDTAARRGHNDVDLRRRRPNEIVQLRVARRVVPDTQERNRLVPRRSQYRREAFHSRRNLGDEDDSHPRSKSRMRSQFVTTLSKSACSVCA